MPPPTLPRLDRPILIVCEGRDDERFLVAMLSALGVTTPFLVEFVEGAGKLGDYILAVRRRPGFQNVRAFAVIRDADNDAAAAFASVRGFLADSGYPVPARSGQLGQGGINGAALTVGVFIMPDGAQPGALEDLYLAALTDDPSLACVNAFLDCTAPHAPMEPSQRSKAQIHAWLASRREPAIRLAQALNDHYVSPWHPAFGPIRAFLQQLAAAPPDRPTA